MLSCRIYHTLVLACLALLGCFRKTDNVSPAQQELKEVIPPKNMMRTFPGGMCRDCKLMFLGMPLKLASVDTMPGWHEEKDKLIIEGTIYQPDRKTPAGDVIVYLYLADHTGQYKPVEGMFPGARRHGHLRGWIKTGGDGKFTFYTSRPAPYPDGKTEARIHVFVKEPYLDMPYQIDDWIFDDDPLVTNSLRKSLKNRGGNSLLKPTTVNGVQLTNQEIILGLNIPDYPQ